MAWATLVALMFNDGTRWTPFLDIYLIYDVEGLIATASVWALGGVIAGFISAVVTGFAVSWSKSVITAGSMILTGILYAIALAAVSFAVATAVISATSGGLGYAEATALFKTSNRSAWVIVSFLVGLIFCWRLRGRSGEARIGAKLAGALGWGVGAAIAVSVVSAA